MRYAIMNLPATYSVHASETFGDYAVQVDYVYLEQFYNTFEDAKRAAIAHYKASNEN